MKGSDYLLFFINRDFLAALNNKIFILKLSLIKAVWNLYRDFSAINFGLKPFQVPSAHACPCVIRVDYCLSFSDR